MKKTSVTLILFLALLATISKTHAQSGPPPMQEVEATGQGANADDAFKQAVNDAVSPDNTIFFFAIGKKLN